MKTAMKTLPQTDWKQLTATISVQGQPYEVKADVFLETKSSADPYSRTGREETIEASLEGWDALPAPSADHYAELEQKLLAEIEDRKHDL